jgi:hypothetical protein
MNHILSVVLAVEIFYVEKALEALKEERFGCGEKCG